MSESKKGQKSFSRCPVCGAPKVQLSTVRDYAYRTPMGKVIIDGASRFKKCGSCREEFIPGELLDRWNKAILDELSEKRALLSPAELQFIFSALPYSQSELAQAVGKERSTLSHYKTGSNPIDPLFDDTLKRIISEHLSGSQETLERLRARLTDTEREQPMKRLRLG